MERVSSLENMTHNQNSNIQISNFQGVLAGGQRPR